jgi:mono/diheme cytochrome c family protein
MKKQIIIPIIAVFLVSAYAILRIGSTGAAPSTEVSYAKDVRPILESRCASCHMGEFVSEGLDMNTYESLMEGSQNGPVIDPGDAKHSLLIKKVTEGEMPKRGPKLTPAQIQILTDWINAGAPNN